MVHSKHISENIQPTEFIRYANSATSFVFPFAWAFALHAKIQQALKKIKLMTDNLTLIFMCILHGN